MIRQAISCDICGTEKKQTNHWFVASEQGGELRIGGWNSRNQRRTETKHLCGQTCLHKLLDEFVARSLGGNSSLTAPPVEPVSAANPVSPRIEASLTSPAPKPFTAVTVPETLQSPAAPAKPVIVSPVTVLPMPMRPIDALGVSPFAPRRSRAEAWERERERTQGRSDGSRPRKCF